MIDFSYTTVINPRAKRLSFTVHPVDGLRVVMPRRLSQRYVKKMLGLHETWIRQQLSSVAKQQKQWQQYTFQDGGTTILYGVPHHIQFVNGPRRVTALDTGREATIVISANTPDTSKRGMQYKRWCTQRAKLEFGEYLQHFAKISGLRYTRFGVRGQKSMWGSCSQAGAISINWKLLCAPVFAQQYVIVHELAHTQELNHSKAFWKIVNTHARQAPAARRWLQRYGDMVQFVTQQFS